jgi:hypothetical protein
MLRNDTLVDLDLDQLHALQLNIVERDLLAEDGVVRHDPTAWRAVSLGKL